jgi:ketosteroid isomerase-like protein
MATQRMTDEADIRRRVDQWVVAIREKDLDRLMSIYAPDIVSFDIDPPLYYTGAAAKRKRWSEVLAMYQRVHDYEVRDLAITCGDEVAFAHSLNRISGTLKNGRESGFWLRWTTCYRKVDGHWLIVHEQLSVPIDVPSGRALLELAP